LNVLHHKSPPIIHRDVKSLNVLLDASLKVKICDFGLSKLTGSKLEEGVGTPQWMAPEVLTSTHYGLPSDVYSYGIVLWELTHRQIPYGNMNQDVMIRGVLSGSNLYLFHFLILNRPASNNQHSFLPPERHGSSDAELLAKRSRCTANF